MFYESQVKTHPKPLTQRLQYIQETTKLSIIYALRIQLEYISKFLFSKLIALNSLNFFVNKKCTVCHTFYFYAFLIETLPTALIR